MEENKINSDNTYQDTEQYLEDIMAYTKACFIRYLKEEIQKGSGNSAWQHLFQDTLLKKETECFLGYRTQEEPDPAKLEALIAQKSAGSLKNGLLLPLEYLCGIFGLNSFERFVLTILTASCMDMNFEKVYAFINNDWKSCRLSGDLAVKLYFKEDYAREDMLSSLSEASRFGRFFIAIDKNSSIYRLKRMLMLKPVVEAFLNGTDHISEEVDFTRCFYPQERLDPILLKDKPYLHILKYLSGLRKDRTALFYLYGAGGVGKKLNIRYAAKELGKPLIFLNFEKLASYVKNGEPIDYLFPKLQAIITETIIRQSLLCISSSSPQLSQDEVLRGILSLVLDYMKALLPVVFLTTDCTERVYFELTDMDVTAIGITAVTEEEYHGFWTGMADGFIFDPEVSLDAFADRFVLTPGQIGAIYKEAAQLSRWQGQEVISRQLLQKVCFEKLEHKLGKKVQKVKMVHQWEDLILPDYQKKMLRAACNQVKYKYKVFSEWGFGQKMAYGTGLSMIFSGPPGTGKTMAAQVLAREIGLELYKIELACVVSKYIGETERSLNEIFEEAAKSQAIIFFDEADVLFSKRTEVKDSNDKYSNMEAAFMLQKIEEYSGIVILATNYQQNIDEAFKRRIKFLIDFPFPDIEYRKKLWMKAFPEKLPMSDNVDYEFLAEHFELSGSNIRNVALNAAFLAASQENEVGMAHIIEAVVNEFTKSGRKLSREDLGEYYMYIQGLS